MDYNPSITFPLFETIENKSLINTYCVSILPAILRYQEQMREWSRQEAQRLTAQMRRGYSLEV